MVKKFIPIAALSLLFLLGLGGCATVPKQELAVARAAVARAYDAGAQRWAPSEYQAASQALHDGEKLVTEGEYDRARKMLPIATLQARQALVSSKSARSLYESRKAEQKALAKLNPPKKVFPKPNVPPPVEHAPPPPPPAKPKVKPSHEPVPVAHHTVTEGETLWSIAARRDIYGDALLWPLLYKANRDQIKDPRQIYPGQVLSIPRDVSEAEKEESRQKARASDVFPLDQLLKNRSSGGP